MNDSETSSAKTGSMGFDDGDCEGCGDRGVDRISTVTQHSSSYFRRERMCAHDDTMRPFDASMISPGDVWIREEGEEAKDSTCDTIHRDLRG